MNARQARRRRRHRWAPLTVVVVDRLPTPPWRPESGAGIELGRVRGEWSMAVICRHQILADDPKRIVAALDFFATTHPDCPVTWVRQYFEPARTAVESLGGLSARPGAPASVVAMIETARTIAGYITAYLEANPPEACGCGPGLELVFRIGSSDPAVIKTCHEDDCSYVGRVPAGHFAPVPMGGLPA